MGQVSLGKFKGYSSNPTYGSFYMYLNYDRITRQDNGLSNKVTFENCYITAIPVYYNKRYTTNTLYIDSVQIGTTSLALSDSWKGCKYWYTKSNGEYEYKPRPYTGGKTTITITVDIGISELDVVMKGHHTGQKKNTQTLNGKITFDPGWSHITEQPTISINDNGDNTATISGVISKEGSNNPVVSSTLYYTTNGDEPQIISDSTQTIKKVVLEPNESGGYSYKIALDTIGGTTVKAMVCCIGEHGDELNIQKESVALRYEKPTPPSNIKIIIIDDNVTITADPGKNVSNNPVTGIKIQYKYNITEKWNDYIYPFPKDKGENYIYIQACSIGTYTGPFKDDKGQEEFLYSNWATANCDISSGGDGENIEIYSSPGKPSIQIQDNENNSYQFNVTIGNNGINNNSSGVEIYYTRDGSEPSEKSNKIALYGSEFEDLASEIFYIEKSLTVKARARTTGLNEKHLYSEWSPVDQKNIIYYKKPDIKIPQIDYIDKLTKKSVITVHQDITIYDKTAWEQYTINIYKNNEHIKSLSKTPTDEEIQAGKVEYEINLKNLSGIKFSKGDKIKFEIIHDVRDGAGNNLANNITIPQSQDYIIQSSGVMRVNVDGKWYEGQVWVKTETGWKEATDVFVNVDGAWKESV